MGIAILIVLLGVELFFSIWEMVGKGSCREEKSVARIAEFLILALLPATGILEWGFRYFMIFAVLLMQAVLAAVYLIKVFRKDGGKKEQKPYKRSRSVRTFLGNGILYAFALLLAILFPQYKPIAVTGDYQVATQRYTWIDESRVEEFSDSGEKRALTVDFWYPEDGDGVYPLVVFSHGAFGVGLSNYSTFAELASNGYVVASISHPYHSFYVMDTNNKLTIADFAFINSVMEHNRTENDEQEFIDTRIWMSLRVADENFVLDTILAMAGSAQSESGTQTADRTAAASPEAKLFTMIDTEKIGLIGHSLGGASAAQLGRERSDISAVVDLDGTMLGEELAYENGTTVLNDVPYPVPLLNIYGEDHYTLAMELVGEDYDNFYISRNAVCAYEVIFKEAGHLNFTDLPLISPSLAEMLGVGTVDTRYCIETMNEIVLEFFNCYLKDGEIPQFEREYAK